MKVICETDLGIMFEATVYIDAKNYIVFRRGTVDDDEVYGYFEMSRVWLFNADESLKLITKQEIRDLLNPLVDMHGRTVVVGDFVCFINKDDKKIKRLVEIIEIPDSESVGIRPHMSVEEVPYSIAQSSISKRWTKVEPA